MVFERHTHTRTHTPKTNHKHEQYLKLYDGLEPPVAFEKVNDRWEVGVGISDGQFQQVSFVNGICTVCVCVCVAGPEGPSMSRWRGSPHPCLASTHPTNSDNDNNR